MNEKKDQKEKQEKRNFWQHRSFFVVVVVGMAVVAIAAILNSMVPDTEQQASTFDSAAWEQAVAEADAQNDAASVAANTDALPANAAPTEQPAAARAVPAATPAAASNPPTTAKPAATAKPSASAAPVGGTAAPAAEAEYEDEATGAGAALETDTEGIPALQKPMDTEVQKAFSGEELVYSETMNDWRVHEGIDFRAAVDDPVKAAADGVVEEAYEDDMLGMTIVISHSGNLRTLYANLKDTSGVTVGQEVKAGDTIGQVGETAALESAQQPHLHFEVIKDMRCVDPMEYMQ